MSGRWAHRFATTPIKRFLSNLEKQSPPANPTQEAKAKSCGRAAAVANNQCRQPIFAFASDL